MDHESLRTASTYINNLLLARGLLRNGEPIDFVKPSKESRAQIINLVHDLILREDRDREQREHVAITLRDLRSEQTRKTKEIAQLKEKQELSTRAATQAQVAERAAQVELKKMERSLKSLQDQTGRLKLSLAQVKTQCATDVRKRDLELTRLKTHLQVQQRGSRSAATAPTMTISHGSRGRAPPKPATPAHGLADPEYNLKQETTEFLTQLSQSLSDENDNLITLIRTSLSTVNELLGLPLTDVHGHTDSAVGSLNGSEGKPEPDLISNLPTPFETLAHDMEVALSQLKNVLSNPNFVNIEEVEIREEEILRLREGWEHMEQRWKDVLIMMDGWLKRINTGQPIDVEDLRRGMGLVSPVHFGRAARAPSLTSQEASLVSEDVSEIKLPASDGDESSVMLQPPQLLSPMGKALVRRISRERSRQKRDVLEPPSSFDLRPPNRSLSPRLDDSEGPNDENIEASDEHDAQELTVAEKLYAAQTDAEQASATRKRAPSPESIRSTKRLQTSNIDTRSTKISRSTTQQEQSHATSMVEKDDTLGQLPEPMVRKTKIRGHARRRKSTLNPQELEALLARNEEEVF